MVVLWNDAIEIDMRLFWLFFNIGGSFLFSLRKIEGILGTVHKSRDAKISVDPPPPWRFRDVSFTFSYLQIKICFGLYKYVIFHKWSVFFLVLNHTTFLISFVLSSIIFRSCCYIMSISSQYMCGYQKENHIKIQYSFLVQ